MFSFTPQPPGGHRSVPRRAALLALSIATVAVVALVGPLPAARAATRTPVTLSIATIKHATPTVAGSTLTVSGTTSRSLVGRRVILQRYVERQWRPTGRSAKVTAKRTFRITAIAAGLGSVRYRVRSDATKTLAAGVSRPKSVVTSQWFYLSALTPVTKSRNFEPYDNVQVGTVDRKKNVAALWSYGSFGGWQDGYAEYNLSSRCSAFDVTAGINDTAGSQARWDFTTIIDGAETDWGYASLNKPIAVRKEVTGAFRIRLENTRIDGSPYEDFKADAVWADAKILCAAKP